MTIKKLLLGISIVIICLTTFNAQSSHDGSRISMLFNNLTKNVWYSDGAPFFNTVDMVYDHGHFYSDKPPIYVLFSAALLKPISFLIDFGSKDAVHALYYVATITSSGFSCLMLVYLMWKMIDFMKCEQNNIGIIIIGCLFGNAFFPYALMYITHMSEALFLLAVFYFILKTNESSNKFSNPLFMGLVSGLNITIHPFVPGFFALLNAGYFFLKKWLSALIIFSVATALISGLGLFLNYKMFGHVKPYYMMPDKYIYAFKLDKKTYYSGFLLNPTVQGLSERQMQDRMNEFKIHPLKQQQFLNRLRSYKEFSKNQFRFAISNWMRWDYLYFNPLMVFTMAVLIKNIFAKNAHYRTEKILVILTILGTYYSSIFQRSMAGNCIGNRYLVPLMPMLFVAAANNISSNQTYWVMFRRLTWLSAAVLIPSIIRPMNEPMGAYTMTSAYLFAITSFFVILFVFNRSIRKYSEIVLNIIFKNHLLNFFIFTLFSLSILKLYTLSYTQQIHSLFIFRTLAVYSLVPTLMFFTLRDKIKHRPPII